LLKEAVNVEDYVAVQRMVRRCWKKRSYKAVEKFERRLDGQPAAKLQRDFYEYGRIDFTPLHYAVFQKDAGAIERRSDGYEKFVDVGDEDGRTPLHHAAEMGLMDVVKLLVEKFQASTEVKDENNSKPLHRAILNGRYCHIYEQGATPIAGLWRFLLLWLKCYS
jgi:ankyrin repeat protein